MYVSTSVYVSEEFIPSRGINQFSGRKSLVLKIFPSGFKKELKQLLWIFFPIVLTSFFRFLNPMISLIMCGHLSSTEFAAASLANSLINILGVSIDLGFSTAFDTLFAQIYGSDQKKKMGSLLQRAVIVMTILYLALAGLHLNIQPFLILLRQDPLISELTTRYITLYLPGLFFDFQFLTISRYLQNQNIVYPMMISSFLGDVFSAIAQYVAIYHLGYALEASAVLQAIACVFMFAIQLGYILVSRIYKDTWSGFSLRDCFDNWKILFVLGIPGILMIALEEWNFEIATFVAGSINEIQLGAQSIAFQCSTISFMLTMGLSIATSIRVGQFLGGRDIDSVKTSYRTSIVIGMVSATTSCILILSLRNYIAAMFSSDEIIQTEGSKLLILIAFMQFADITAGLTSGVLKACGRQFLGAGVMFTCYYVIGVPLGLILIFVFKTNIEGMWIGLLTALLIEGIVFGVVIFRTDWEIECNKAMANVEEVVDTSEFESACEKRPLIVKSDFEGGAHWVREKIYNPKRKIKNIRRNRQTSGVFTMPTNRSRSMMVIKTQTFKIDTDQPLGKLLIKRAVTVAVVLIFFASAVLIRLFLPKTLYLPCIPTNNQTLYFYRIDPEILCKLNETTFQ